MFVGCDIQIDLKHLTPERIMERSVVEEYLGFTQYRTVLREIV